MLMSVIHVIEVMVVSTSDKLTQLVSPYPLYNYSEVLSPLSILNALNPDDHGEESVNPKTYFQVMSLCWLENRILTKHFHLSS